jgi:hypothetical protein
MDYMTAKQAAELWGLSVRRVQTLCGNGQIPTAARLGRVWAIPKGTPKPLDGRTKAAKREKIHGRLPDNNYVDCIMR